MKDEEDTKEKELPFVQRMKAQLFMLMQGVLESSEIGFPRVLFTKIFEFLILLTFSFHDKVLSLPQS
ncbi:MAG: hypothetical protein P4M11_09880 [Candidatus Pacebacteria bacterium]|nr:hypothetical protein [Candidatus Paceibacterota bacterium]